MYCMFVNYHETTTSTADHVALSPHYLTKIAVVTDVLAWPVKNVSGLHKVPLIKVDRKGFTIIVKKD